MKTKIALLGGLLLAGANAMACYTVYDGNNRVVYQGVDAPVDMSLPLHEALAARFPARSSLVFNQSATCTPIGIAQVARPATSNVPMNTIRMERTGRQLSPTPSSGASPLLTDRATAQRQGLPHTVLAGDIVLVPAQAAARASVPTFTVIPADTAVAHAPDTRAMGAGPSRHGTRITEMRDPPLTIVEQGGHVSVYKD